MAGEGVVTDNSERLVEQIKLLIGKGGIIAIQSADEHLRESACKWVLR
jgi:hypothetical protein